ASATAKAAMAARAARLKRAFTASSDLRPMAQQLLQWRSDAAYEGVETYARRHAESDAGGLAHLALGYAHFLDHEFAKSAAELKQAQPNAGDLGDYVAYFLASDYAGQEQYEAATALLKDFATKYPESLFARDAALLYANTLV